MNLSFTPLDASIQQLVAVLNFADREAFEEIAAIRQFDGGMSKAQAEHEAILDVLARQQHAITVQAFRLDVEERTDWLITTTPEAAKAYARHLGDHTLVEIALADVLHAQYHGLACLTPPP